MTDSEQSEVLTRALAGDRVAFNTLVRAHQSAVRQQLRRLTNGDLALADDLAQETFIQAWAHLAGFRREARLSSWLYQIAYNRFLMCKRGQHSSEGLTDESDNFEKGHDPIRQQDLERDMVAAMASLPEVERVALIHCYHMDLSHEEAALVLGMPVGTIKSQVLRGKSRLREILAAWAPEKKS